MLRNYFLPKKRNGTDKISEEDSLIPRVPLQVIGGEIQKISSIRSPFPSFSRIFKYSPADHKLNSCDKILKSEGDYLSAPQQ